MKTIKTSLVIIGAVAALSTAALANEVIPMEGNGTILLESPHGGFTLLHRSDQPTTVALYTQGTGIGQSEATTVTGGSYQLKPSFTQDVHGHAMQVIRLVQE
ncbi:MAG: hypothetical protein QM796_08175 [Chthoniobacteraceae bacterium]